HSFVSHRPVPMHIRPTHPHLHPTLLSFPTRRSSDLPVPSPPGVRSTGTRPPVPGRRRASAGSRPPALPAALQPFEQDGQDRQGEDRKSTRLNSSHVKISYAVFCLKKEKHNSRRLLAI